MNDQDEQVIEVDDQETIWNCCLRHKVIKQELKMNEVHAVTSGRVVNMNKTANQNKLEEFDTIRILLKLLGGSAKQIKQK